MKKMILLCGGLSLLVVSLGGCATTSSVATVDPAKVSATLNAQVTRYGISVPAGASDTFSSEQRRLVG